MNKKVIRIIVIIIILACVITGFFVIRHKIVLERNRKIMRDREEAAKNRKDGPIGGGDSENQIRVPNLKGMTFEEAQDKLESSGFERYYFSKTEIDSELEEGLIVKTQPGQGVSFNKSDFIDFTFYISNGKYYKNDEVN